MKAGIIFRQNFLPMFLWVLSVMVLVSCDNDDDNPAPPMQDPTIAELAANTPELSILADAVGMFPDLATALSGPGTYTVFAPTNDAFNAALTAIGQTSLDDIPEDVLRGILEYHVAASAALESGDLSDGQTVGMLSGDPVTIGVNGATVTVNDATVTTADIVGSNGVVHIVDAVLVPADMAPILGTIVAPIFFNKDFTTLVAAVAAADADILSVLLGNGPSDMGLTVFAPTNEAFEAAGITELPDAATLTAVLQYHVLDGTVTSADLPAGSATIPTLGGDFYLSNVDAGVFINGNTQVTEVDITGSNGVVHVIDRTLLPPSQHIADVVSAFAAGDPAEFTLLLAALVHADLVDVFTGDGPFTVFAPTDAAFNNAGFADAAAIQALDPAAVAGILTHHVVKANARVFSSDLTDGQVITMLNDQNVTVDLQNLTIQDAAGSTPAAGLVADNLNVLATNGVIHVINEVLIPAQ